MGWPRFRVRTLMILMAIFAVDQAAITAALDERDYISPSIPILGRHYVARVDQSLRVIACSATIAGTLTSLVYWRLFVRGWREIRAQLAEDEADLAELDAMIDDC